MTTNVKVKLHEAFNKCYRTIGRAWLERQLPRLSPLASQSNLDDAKTVCIVMGARRTRAQHVLTSYLWRKFLPPSIPVVMVCDVPFEPELRKIVSTLFSGAETIIDAQSLLEGIGCEHIKRFVQVHRFGRKFLAIYSLSQTHHVVYSDDDILVFREPVEFLTARDRDVNYLYSPDVSGVPYAMHRGMVRSATERGVEPLPDFQAGLLYVKRGVLDESLVNSFLENWTPDNDVHFAEQTLFSLMLSHVGDGDLLPRHLYINDPAKGRFFGGEDVDYSVRPILRHYMGTVRHRYFQMARRLLSGELC